MYLNSFFLLIPFIISSFLVFQVVISDARSRPRFPKPVFRNSNNPSTSNCTEKYFNQRIDHFTSAIPPLGKVNYGQRYYICDQYWGGSGYPIFIYLGNEGEVTLYVNNTGLMWENAPEFGALLIFAEHRYYGTSRPFGDDDLTYPQYLSSEQALADYAVLISSLKKELNTKNSAVIGFGGSYGGMLATWFRYKYPHIIDGSIAASAPIWDFLGEEPLPNAQGYFEIVTNDASEVCQQNVRAAWDIIFAMANADEFSALTEIFSLCSPLETLDDVWTLAYWIQDGWSSMAMGNYPYPSSYMTDDGGELPAWPVSVACSYLEDPSLQNNTDGSTLLTNFKNAFGVYYNNTNDLTCFDILSDDSLEGELWENQYCSEIFMLCCGTNGVTDMFWNATFDVEAEVQSCQESYNVTPRKYWFNINFGGRNIKSTSNIVFSNGNLDPWSVYGVQQNLSDSLIAVKIEDGAHHLDLMFSNPDDPESVIEAREIEMSYVRKWINEKKQSN